MNNETDMASDQKPSMINKTTAVGAMGGLLASTGLPLAAVCGMALAGGGIGGFIGKKEQERAQSMHTEPPTMFNSSALLGALIGIVAVRLIAFGVVSYLGLAAAAATPAVATGVAAAMAVGLYLGGRYGKKCLETEYEQQTRDQVSKLLEKSLHSVPPQLMQGIIDQGKDHLSGPEKQFAEDVIQQRILNQQAQPGTVR